MLLYSKEVNKALRIMLKAHEGQVDKQGLPYFIHPLVVASDMHDTTSTVVALLHDVLEDSDYTEKDLREEGFSEEVICALKLLKHDDDVPYMDYIEALKYNEIARRVKKADLCHNRDTRRFDGAVPERVLDKIKNCYQPAYQILDKAEYRDWKDSSEDKAHESIGEGKAVFLVKDEEFRQCGDSEFVQWLRRVGFQKWDGSKVFVPMPVLYINLNSRKYSFGMPGISITSSVCNHAITKDEFMQIYNIYKKYEGLQTLQMSADE